MTTINYRGLWEHPGNPAGAAGPAMRSVVPASAAAQLAANVRGRASLGDRPGGNVTDWLQTRHVMAARRAEAVRLADCARWSQHNADACWYSGKLRAARQFDAQAARERALGAWLTAEADALGAVL